MSSRCNLLTVLSHRKIIPPSSNISEQSLRQWVNIHDDVIKWKYFPRNWPFVRGIHRSPVNSPHKGQWRGAFVFSLICVWINDWVNNREAGDLRRHRGHYDVNVIQIKICAEYRDMLPRPRLVCQEPGLRPIGRSPGVPDKSSRGLGSMSRYSAQILICFIAYIFLFFVVSSVGLVGNCAGLPSCTVPSAIGHCNQNEAGHQIIKAPSMPCWGAAGLLNSLWHLCHRTGEIDR